jgi:hypothetical protein
MNLPPQTNRLDTLSSTLKYEGQISWQPAKLRICLQMRQIPVSPPFREPFQLTLFPSDILDQSIALSHLWIRVMHFMFDLIFFLISYKRRAICCVTNPRFLELIARFSSHYCSTPDVSLSVTLHSSA